MAKLSGFSSLGRIAATQIVEYKTRCRCSARNRHSRGLQFLLAQALRSEQGLVLPRSQKRAGAGAPCKLCRLASAMEPSSYDGKSKLSKSTSSFWLSTPDFVFTQQQVFPTSLFPRQHFYSLSLQIPSIPFQSWSTTYLNIKQTSNLKTISTGFIQTCRPLTS